MSKDENLTKPHGRFLESRFIALAHQAKRCTVTNATEPPDQGRLPEADEVEMEEFISQARLLLGTLGYNLFSPIQDTSAKANAPHLQPKTMELVYSGDGFSASCIVDSVSSGQFVVRKDSKARKQEAPSLQETYKTLRAQLRETGVLMDDTDGDRFTQHYAFPAISRAAQVVSGSPVNGRVVWKLKDGSKSFAE